MRAVRPSISSSGRTTSVFFPRCVSASPAVTATDVPQTPSTLQKGKGKAIEPDAGGLERLSRRDVGPVRKTRFASVSSEFEALTRQYDHSETRPPEKKGVKPRPSRKTVFRNFDDFCATPRLPPVSLGAWGDKTSEGGGNSSFRPRSNEAIPITFGSGATEGRVQRYGRTTEQRQNNSLRVVEALRPSQDTFKQASSAATDKEEAEINHSPASLRQELSQILGHLSPSKHSYCRRSPGPLRLARPYSSPHSQRNYSTSSPSTGTGGSTSSQRVLILMPNARSPAFETNTSETDKDSRSGSEMGNSTSRDPSTPGQVTLEPSIDVTKRWPGEAWSDDWGADELAPPVLAAPPPPVLAALRTTPKSRRARRAVAVGFNGRPSSRGSLGQRLLLMRQNASDGPAVKETTNIGNPLDIPSGPTPLRIGEGSAQDTLVFYSREKAYRKPPDAAIPDDHTGSASISKMQAHTKRDAPPPRTDDSTLVGMVKLALSQASGSENVSESPPLSQRVRKRAAKAAKFRAKGDFLAALSAAIPLKRKEAKAQRNQQQAETLASVRRGTLNPLPRSAQILEDVFPHQDTRTIPRLAHGLDRVLFNPSVHWIQDPHSRVYNFPPNLQNLPAVTEFAFERLAEYVSSSRDQSLRSLAAKYSKRFAGSTSSLTGFLSHIYFLISGDRPVDTSTLSMAFMNEPRSFTPGIRMPAAVIMHHNRHRVAESGLVTSTWTVSGDRSSDSSEPDGPSSEASQKGDITRLRMQSDSTNLKSASVTAANPLADPAPSLEHKLAEEPEERGSEPASLDASGEWASTTDNSLTKAPGFHAALDAPLRDDKPTQAFEVTGHQGVPTDLIEDSSTEFSSNVKENAILPPIGLSGGLHEAIDKADRAVSKPVGAEVGLPPPDNKHPDNSLGKSSSTTCTPLSTTAAVHANMSLDDPLCDIEPCIEAVDPKTVPTDPPEEPSLELTSGVGGTAKTTSTEKAPERATDKLPDRAVPQPVDAGIGATPPEGSPGESTPVMDTLPLTSESVHTGTSSDVPLRDLDPPIEVSEATEPNDMPLYSSEESPLISELKAKAAQESENSNQFVDTYAIDGGTGDTEERRLNVLIWLGTMAEKFLTMSEPQFTALLRKNPMNETLVDNKRGESYRYAKSKQFVMRSQLDCQDSRLPGTGVFDIKTRAVLPIRVDQLNYLQNAGYQIRTMTGLYESFEREYYDLIRSAFLKYNFQARIGNMDGVFVAYHNTARMFGFQYVPVTEMEDRIYGPGAPGRGTSIFEKCVRLLEILCEEAVACFPGQSLACTVEARQSSGNLKIWVVPTENPQNKIVELTATVRHTINGIAVNSSQAIDHAHERWQLHYNITRSTTEPAKIWAALNSVKNRQFPSTLPEGVSKDKMAERLALVNFGAGRGLDQRPPPSEKRPKGEESTEDARKTKFAQAGSRVKFLRHLAKRGWKDLERERNANQVVFGVDIDEGVLRGPDNESIQPSTVESIESEDAGAVFGKKSGVDSAASLDNLGIDTVDECHKAERVDGQNTSGALTQETGTITSSIVEDTQTTQKSEPSSTSTHPILLRDDYAQYHL